jgi:signal transduction histidine kinase
MSQVKIEELQALLNKREQELIYKQEELDSQRGMLSAAIQELVIKNQNLEVTLDTLKTKNDELSGLLYSASHGLKTPAVSVQAFVQLLRNEPLNEASSQYVDYLERLSDHIIEIMTALTSLSTISRLQKDNLIFETIELDQIVNNNISHFSKLSESKGVQIHYSSSIPSLSINTIPVAFNEIVKQLLMNGIVFRQPSTDGYVSVDFNETDDHLVLCIKDNGDGIRPDMIDSIFDMFFRGSEKSGGSGLGLFLVSKAVDILNGSISVESQLGNTVFEVSLPIHS